MYNFHRSGFGEKIDPRSDVAAVLRLALCASEAAYAEDGPAVVEALRPHPMGTTKVMWSDGFTESDPVRAGFCHPHVVAEAAVDHRTTWVVACRGSVTMSDWATDLSAALDRSRAGWEGQVHGGFLRRAETIPVEPLLEHLRHGGHVMFTGHSLGSAVAEVLCIKVVMHIMHNELQHSRALVDRVVFVGFASPVVCTDALGGELRASHGRIFHHVQTEHDIVPMLSHVAAVHTAKQSTSGWWNTLTENLPRKAKAAVNVASFAASLLLKAVAPNLTKGYGWWYCAAANGMNARALHSQEEVDSYHQWETQRIEALNAKTTILGAVQHRIGDYRRYFRELMGPQRGTCHPALLFVFDASTVRIRPIAQFDRERLVLRVTMYSPASRCGSPLANVARAEVTMGGQKVGRAEVGTPPYVAVMAEPHERCADISVLPNALDEIVDKSVSSVTVTFRGIYAACDEPPTIAVNVRVTSM